MKPITGTIIHKLQSYLQRLVLSDTFIEIWKVQLTDDSWTLHASVRNDRAIRKQSTKNQNMYYPNDINPMPARYDKAKRKKDDDGEEYFMIDRVYGGLYGHTLRQADGTEYRGKL